MNEIKLYCDSCCDLSVEEYNDMCVTMIPLITTIKEKEYIDRIDIKPKGFYEILREDGVSPKTSMINPERFVEAFKDDVDKGNTIIFLSLSSGISSSVNSAFIAKKELGYEDLHIVDSLGACVGQGLMIKKAVQMRDEKIDAIDIVNELKYMSENMRYLFCPGSLEMLKRGGRISATKAAIGTILNIKPICHFNEGKIEMLSKVRGEKAFVKFCVNYLKENGFDETYKFGIAHAMNEKMVELLKSSVENEFGVDDTFIGEIGAVIGSHTGEGTIALFFMKK